ncbi:LysR family transcriptional regulator [Leucothrix arctica]|uniref:LysR family transcriptional regulator n=1 Tax=Leucothrix arctica TaxID=1481894 RepID=A0A317CAV7_9GAMM|nr:LysR family transcriptional regulator [Leucothrix arctica]PWQ95678.1 LysR family transcriptional regulator [Leucothrix arctica]
MNIKQLKFAKAVVENESFSLAAKQCFVSQPTLSNGIQALENEFGFVLFKRTTRSVQLSSFGAEVLPFITSILNAEKALFDHIEKSKNVEKSIIRLGVSPLVNNEMILLIIAAYKKINARCEILVNENNLDDLQRELDNELLDIIFVPNVPGMKSKKVNEGVFLYEEALHVIMKNSLFNEEKITLSSLGDETILMVPDSCGLSVITRGMFKTTGKIFKEYGGKANSYHVLANWAYSGLGVALLPKSKIPDHIKDSVTLFKNGNVVKIKYEARWSDHSIITQEFLNFSQEHLVNISGGLVKN